MCGDPWEIEKFSDCHGEVGIRWVTHNYKEERVELQDLWIIILGETVLENKPNSTRAVKVNKTVDNGFVNGIENPIQNHVIATFP